MIGYSKIWRSEWLVFVEAASHDLLLANKNTKFEILANQSNRRIQSLMLRMTKISGSSIYTKQTCSLFVMYSYPTKTHTHTHTHTHTLILTHSLTHTHSHTTSRISKWKSLDFITQTAGFVTITNTYNSFMLTSPNIAYCLTKQTKKGKQI